MPSPPFSEGREAGFEKSGTGVRPYLKKHIIPLRPATRAETQLFRISPLATSRISSSRSSASASAGQFTNNFLFSVRWFPLDGFYQFEGLLYLSLRSPENKPYSSFRTADSPCTGLKGSCSRQYVNCLQLCDDLAR